MRRKNYGDFQFRVQKKIFPKIIGFLIPYAALFWYFFEDNVWEIFNPFDLFNYIFIGAGVIFFLKTFLKRLFIDMYEKGMIFKIGKETGAVYYEEIDLISYGIDRWRTLEGGSHSKAYLSFENSKRGWSKRLYVDDLPRGKERIRFLAFILKRNPTITCDEDVARMCEKRYLNGEIVEIVFLIALAMAATGFPLYGVLK